MRSDSGEIDITLDTLTTNPWKITRALIVTNSRKRLSVWPFGKGTQWPPKTIDKVEGRKEKDAQTKIDKFEKKIVELSLGAISRLRAFLAIVEGSAAPYDPKKKQSFKNS
mmetsp:Transcript_29091/g.44420  ORF Transcript_29091/g.44420 Transcript_29091/m.44420 type:complete len:110 (-) Transcript_29091:136-465(-)